LRSTIFGLIFREHAQADIGAAAVLVDELGAGGFEYLAQGGFVSPSRMPPRPAFIFSVSPASIFHLGALRVHHRSRR
jgi:hypothetical protein